MALALVLGRRVPGHAVVKGNVPSLDLHRNRPDLHPFGEQGFIVQGLQGISGSRSNRTPAMGPRHHPHAAVFDFGVVQRHPRPDEVSRLDDRPCWKVLMPADATTACGGFGNDLIVPDAENWGVAAHPCDRTGDLRITRYLEELLTGLPDIDDLPHFLRGLLGLAVLRSPVDEVRFSTGFLADSPSTTS